MSPMYWSTDPAEQPGELTDQHHYPVAALLPPLIVGDEGIPLYSCPECGAAVFDTVAHDRHHAGPESSDAVDEVTLRNVTGDVVETRTIRCNCPPEAPMNGQPLYWYCAVHDRGNRPAGQVLRDGGIVDSSSTLRAWGER